MFCSLNFEMYLKNSLQKIVNLNDLIWRAFFAFENANNKLPILLFCKLCDKKETKREPEQSQRNFRHKIGYWVGYNCNFKRYYKFKL